MNVAFTLSVEEAREITISPDPDPYAIDRASKERFTAIRSILDRCVVEKSAQPQCQRREGVSGFQPRR